MKIVQVQTQAEAAGAQRISELLGDYLRGQGHEVRTVFMYRKTDAYDRDPYADFVMHRRPQGMLGQLKAAIGLFGYLRRARPDAVISFQHYGNIFGTIGGRLAGARRLIANQSAAPFRSGLPGAASWIDRQMGRLGLYHSNVVNSAWTEAQFAGYPPRYRTHLRRIDHGVAAPLRRYDRSTARAAFDLPLGGPLVVTTGRLTPAKNQLTLIEAIAGLDGVHLALAGAGPAEATLRDAAVRHGAVDRVHFVGELRPARVHEFLAAGDVFAFASLSETFGLSAVEAAIAGLPVVASDLPVLREVLTNGDGQCAGLFAAPQNPVAFRTAIASLFEQPQLGERLSQAGRRLRERYAPEVMGRAYEALLTE